MEWLRSCYSSEWRLFRNSALTSKGRYFFAPAGTPHYPGLHNLGSRNWTSDERDPAPQLGETATLVRPYSKGQHPAGVPPALLIGTADCIANGDTLPLPIFTPPRTFPGGIDSRCYLAAGLPVPLDAQPAAVGGCKEGGTATATPSKSSSAIGGTKDGRSATATAKGMGQRGIGGSKPNGRNTSNTKTPHPSRGGCKEGGSAAVIPSTTLYFGGGSGSGGGSVLVFVLHTDGLGGCKEGGHSTH